MQIIFIRHAEPDYSVDSLTPEGFREADALAKRVAKWKGFVTECFCSPLGRAQATAKPSLQVLGMEAKTIPWLREFSISDHERPDGSHRKTSVIWDLLPDYWTADPRFSQIDGWTQTEYISSHASEIEPRWKTVRDGMDEILASYGYVHEDGHYRILPNAQRDAVLVFFCHLGLAGVACGHVLNVAPPVLWHAFFLPPSSVSILNSEERQGDIAGFRCQTMGDTSHLAAAGLSPSPMGGFQNRVFSL